MSISAHSFDEENFASSGSDDEYDTSHLHMDKGVLKIGVLDLRGDDSSDKCFNNLENVSQNFGPVQTSAQIDSLTSLLSILRPLCAQAKPVWYGYNTNKLTSVVTASNDSPMLKQAINTSPQKVKLRKAAIEEEFLSLSTKSTWTKLKSSSPLDQTASSTRYFKSEAWSIWKCFKIKGSYGCRREPTTRQIGF